MVTLSKKFEHITPVLKSVHWLPIKVHILFKVLIIVWKILHDQAPLYLTTLLQIWRLRPWQVVREVKPSARGRLLMEALHWRV